MDGMDKMEGDDMEPMMGQDMEDNAWWTKFQTLNYLRKISLNVDYFYVFIWTFD